MMTDQTRDLRKSGHAQTCQAKGCSPRRQHAGNEVHDNNYREAVPERQAH